MSKLTDLINQLSTEIANTRISNEEFRRVQEILLEMRIEVRKFSTPINSFTITAGGGTSNIATSWPGGTSTYNTSDVVV